MTILSGKRCAAIASVGMSFFLLSCGSGTITKLGADGMLTKADALLGSIAAAAGTSRSATVVYPTCDSSGNPTGVSSSDADYPYLLFWCKATANGSNVESFRGSFAVFRAVFCSMQSKLSTMYENTDAYPYTTDGTDIAPLYLAAKGQALTLTVNTDCWPQALVDQIGSGTELPVISIMAYSLDSATTGYQKRISATVTLGSNKTYDVRFFQTNTDSGEVSKFGFKKADTGTSGSVGSVVEVMVDAVNGVALFNSIDDRFGASGASTLFRRNVRFKAKGTLTGSILTFSAISALQGILFQSGVTPVAYADLDNSFSVTTVKGTPTNGFTGKVYGYSGSLSLTSTTCSLHSSCATEAGLPVTASDIGFYTSTANTTRTTHIASGYPLCDGGDLTFAAVPTTGILGVCAR